VYVLPRRSDSKKDVGASSAFQDASLNDSSIDFVLRSIVARTDKSNIFRPMNFYMGAVSALSAPSRQQRFLNILRFVPSFTYMIDTASKILIKDKLLPFYRAVRPNNQWGYTNYNCLNFFTGSKVPSDSVFLYPNVSNPVNYASSSYNVTG